MNELGKFGHHSDEAIDAEVEIADLTRERDEARAEAAAMRAAHILSICGLCRDGIPVEAPTAVLTSWFHRSPNGSWRGDCRADAIRRLPPSTAGRDLLARMKRMRAALIALLDAASMGPLDIAAKYGPDAPDPLIAASEQAKAALADQPGEKE